MSSLAITIGGAIAADQVPTLAKLVYEAGGGWDYDAGYESVDDAAETIRRAIAEAESLAVMFDALREETLAEIVQLLRELGLPHSISQDFGLDGCSISLWLPGFEKPLEWMECDGFAVLTSDQIGKHLAAGTLEAELALMAQCDTFPFKLTEKPAGEQL